MPDILPNAKAGLIAVLELPDVDSGSCALLGTTALIVQGVMGVLVILSLVYKRHREATPRPWRIWLFDVSKQIFGQMFVHGVNVLISDLVGTHTGVNACVFYFLNILVDTTLGIGVIYLVLRVLTHGLSERLQLKGFTSGQYGNPPSINFWIRQTAVYITALTTMKFIVVALFALFPGLFIIGEWLLSWTNTPGGDDHLQVIFTMGLFPIIMNVLQFWLIDSIVKASAVVALSGEEDSRENSHDREPLFAAGSDDEDDDEGHRGRHDIENPPPPVKRSRSNSPPQKEDSKSMLSNSSTSTIVPGRKAGNNNATSDDPNGGGTSRAFGTHAYPPTSTSPTSSKSPTSASSIRSNKRRSPPAPLHIHTLTQPAVNSPDIKSSSRLPLQPKTPKTSKLSAVPIPKVAEEWTESWDDYDWAGKVGEEEWTGKRMEEKKGALEASWDRPTTTVLTIG